jgi:chromosome partitioning protein
MELRLKKLQRGIFLGWRENKESGLIVSTAKTSVVRSLDHVLEGTMSIEKASLARPARVIVVGNEKGGSGKSTVAMHIAMALIKPGQRVATIDLDTRQRSFTHYIENRRAWAQHIDRELEIPEHACLGAAEDDAAGRQALADVVDALAQRHDFIVIDTPGHDSHLTR